MAVKDSKQIVLAAVVGVLFGIAATLLAQRVFYSDSTIPKAPLNMDVNQEAVALGRPEMLLIHNGLGTALIDITKSDNGSAEYRWRYKAANPSEEQHGQGRVFEKYEQRQISPGNFQVDDVGSVLMIEAGPFQILWSSGGGDQNYLYIDRNEMRTKVLPDANFDTFPLDHSDQ